MNTGTRLTGSFGQYRSVTIVSWSVKLDSFSTLQDSKTVDAAPSVYAQAQFSIYHHVLQACSQGHTSILPRSPAPRPVLNFDVWMTTVLRKIYPNGDITVAHYLDHYIPRNDAKQPDHAHLTTAAGSCTTCAGPTTATSVRISWPKILTCSTKEFVQNPTPDSVWPTRLHWPEQFSITDPLDHEEVEYRLVGHIHHEGGNHYTADIRFNGRSYSYNDMAGGRKPYSPLKEIKAAKSLSKSQTIPGHVYVRLSSKHTVSSISNLWSTIRTKLHFPWSSF